jgi:hypothetical protein
MFPKPVPNSPRISGHDTFDLMGIHALHLGAGYVVRPNHQLRRIVHEKVASFGLQSPCAVMHVRRGDSMLLTGDERYYIGLGQYLNSSRPALDALGIKTVLLLTDSSQVLLEVASCASDYPELCRDLNFRYLEKPRWIAAEGKIFELETLLASELHLTDEYVYTQAV